MANVCIFHNNGKVWKKIIYQNDKRDGEYLSYYENDQLLEKSYWENGKRIG